MTQESLNATERKAALSLAAVFGVRMLGLFLIMPVLAIYAQNYPDYSATMVGVALGAYGLTQALLQIPLGIVSDRIGRRPVIVGGLLLFAVGSVVAATSDTLTGIAIGRAIQGTGAIAAAILALAADVSRDDQRPKVMATIGMCIGFAFAIALVLGPLLASAVGLKGVFWLTAASALLGIGLLLFSVPKVVNRNARREALPVLSEMGQLLKHKQLWRLNFGVFVLHAMMTAWFVNLPLQLEKAGLDGATQAWLYLPTLVLSFVFMIPMLIMSARSDAPRLWFRAAIGLLLLAMLMIETEGSHFIGLVVAVIVFFTGFNFLEATLPSLLTRIAPPGSKGSASGLYTTCQFLGAFIGGSAGGYLLQHDGLDGVMLFAIVLLLCWLAITYGMRYPAKAVNAAYDTPALNAQQAEQLADKLVQIAGVEEARVVTEERKTYLKIDKKQFDESAVKALLKVE
ncbi:MFS transporter [Idiomarina tyrosinivorans]|uniref:MFS transporter n=1 Tax=Idiomarina tyrosinivorans TaxID=1445662 RepID=A0A432ZQP6_9GAMM|nr:MFS transporter [Idiomarina tyrosinivorans]RUO80158.1 MFS transporter [Idiomarina tyrosinivorans]